MIRAFIKDYKYVHRKFIDVYIDCIDAVEYDDFYIVVVIWKLQRNDSILLKQAQKIAIHKTALVDWYAWQE